MAADRITEKTIVEADIDSIYDVVTDLAAYPSWQEEFKEAEVLETDDEGYATRGRFRLAAMGLSASMVLDYTRSDDAISWTLAEGDLITRNDGSYRFNDLGDGRTEVTYELVVESTAPMPGFMKRKLAQKIASDSLKNIKKRAEAGA